MCGIVAIVSTAAPVDSVALEAAMHAMAHRGPDGRGHWVDARGVVGLGHVRLAIMDPVGGRQPMASEDGLVQLVANGEFYDFERLRRELSARGHTFATRSDSEVAVHLYEALGPSCLSQLRGEFAFALWDARTQTLLAARDRFGIKPLYFAQWAGRVFVASEVKALFAAGVPAAWDDDAMFQSLHFAPQQDRTPYRCVRQVPPGQFLQVHQGRVTLTSYWDPVAAARQRDVPADEQEATEAVSAALDEAVRLRTRSDVPIACYLSGGVDSSAVLGIATRVTGRPVPAFTIAFDHVDYDESALAGQMAAHAGAPFHPIRVTSADFAGVFEDAVAVSEMPHINGHGPARYLLSREVRKAGFKVVLGGEGADEVFAGYHFVRAALQRSAGGDAPADRAWWRAARIARRVLSVPSTETRALGGISPLLGVASHVLGFPTDLVRTLNRRFEALRGLLAPDFLARHRARDPFREFLSQFDWTSIARQPAHRLILFLWLRSHFAQYVLGGERLDMAHAVEMRLPFLDHHFFELGWNLPAAMLFRDGRDKHLLRRIAAADVAPAVLAKKKQPFMAPPSTFGRGNPLHELVRELLTGKAFEDLPFFDAAAVRRFVEGTENADPSMRASLDPVLFHLASLAVLQRRYRLAP